MGSLSAPRKGVKIPLGCLITVAVVSMICSSVFCVTAAGGVIKGSTPTPTRDTSQAKSLALTSAWLAATQTAMALPTSTFTATTIPTETLTASPSPTLANTATPLPTLTFTPVPTATAAPYLPPAAPAQPAQPTSNYPANLTAICNDGSYSYSKTARGTCSGHDGVRTWINHP
jgi:hypothetical protein